jgi:predicted RNA binding protein with dsRBD fold (UPF0201 family)
MAKAKQMTERQRQILAELHELDREAALDNAREELAEEREENLSIATDFEKWMEYMDPDGIMTEDEFDSLAVEAKLELIREAFEWTFKPDPRWA